MRLSKSGVGTFAGVLTATLATACGGGLSDARYPTGSGQMTTSSDHRALYVASTDHGQVTRFDLETKATQAFDVGSEPLRIARAGDYVFVTLHGERKVAVLVETDGGLELHTTIDVGAEPYGVVAEEGGDMVYVAVSLADKVVAIDVEDMAISAEFAVKDQPRWLALHPSNDSLYVGAGFNGSFFRIDLGNEEVEQFALPHVDRGANALPLRVMGDMAVSSDGYYVAVPTMNLDPNTPIDDTNNIPPNGYYGGRTDHVVVLVPADGNGELDLDGSRMIAMNNGGLDQPLGYAANVTFDPSGYMLYASIEGAAQVAVIDIEEVSSSGGLFDGLFNSPTSGPNGVFFNSETPAVGYVTVPEGPRSIVFTDDNEAYVYGFLDRAVVSIDTTDVAILDNVNRGFAQTLTPPAVTPAVQIAGAAFTPEIEEGRRLFYANNIETVSSPISGLSCNTCHYDARTDGLSWTFTRGKRQTPSLAGPVSLTQPVRWEGDRETVEIDAIRTSRDAMGGTKMSETQAAKVAAYIDSTRDADVPLAISPDPAITRGLEIFSRDDVGCANCHFGARMTDNMGHPMFGMNSVQTRSLIGLASSAPYLHDGSAATIRDVLLMSRNGEMGNTGSLTEAELDDLTMFLGSL